MIFVPGRLLCKGVDDRIFVEAGVCKEKKMNWGTVPAGNIAAMAVTAIFCLPALKGFLQ
jgi:hypothetical protein